MVAYGLIYHKVTDISHLSKISSTLFSRGGGACSKLSAQITNESLKNGCAKFAISLIEAQKVGAQMRTLSHLDPLPLTQDYLLFSEHHLEVKN